MRNIIKLARLGKTVEEWFFKGMVKYFVLQLILYIVLCAVITLLVLLLTRMNMPS